MSPFCALFTALVVAWTDFKSGRMPNAITLGSLCLALGMRGGMEGGAGAATAVAGALAVSSVPAGLFYWTKGRAIGGGDVKALAALGAWLGPLPGLELELLAFTLLALWGLLQALRRGRLLTVLAGSFLPGRREQQQTSLILGPALGLAALFYCGLPLLASFLLGS